MYVHWVFKRSRPCHGESSGHEYQVAAVRSGAMSVWQSFRRTGAGWTSKWITRAVTALAVVAISGCTVTVPQNIDVVSPFDINRYLGQWYEIARLDHSFERDMIKVSAIYSLSGEEGSIRVVNRGFDTRTQEWDEAVGRAKFLEGTNTGALKVSFFGPFYGGYFITALDQENYQWAMVVGPDLKYFWILSRDKSIDPLVKTELLTQARKMGIPVDQIIWVEQ
ncbi:lipocalin family protein [Orrella marina]|nr:lipocalin family protein [Orrella marina]